jgi:L-threonylcarbamoyladenylate synthase
MIRLKTQDTATTEIVKTAVRVLQEGGLVIFPTETVYGAGVDTTNQAAVDKLLAYKSRREGKPLSIAVTDTQMAEKYVELNDQARALYRQFMPGPVTVVSRSRGLVAEGVASEFGTLGARIPDYDLVVEIVRAFGRPITATSANASGRKRPYSIEDVFAGLSEKQKSLIDLIIDAGELPHNEPSTVIDTTLSAPVTLRSGGLQGRGMVGSAKAGTELALHSSSEQETMEIAGRLLLKHWDAVADHGVVFALEGPLGVGKTVFAKGLAQFLQIKDNISSPTYTYIEEYDFRRHQTAGHFYHLDMWKVESAEELERLRVTELLQPGTVSAIEWYSQVAAWLEPAITKLGVPLIKVEIDEGNESDERKLLIREN